jgi:DNA-binding winged helix-turn-helix (wHTH) protein/Flp pilus assembly protein TadD
MQVAPQQEINLLSRTKLKTRDELSNVVRSARVQFGVFEINLRERELRKCGLRIKLQQKPFQILRRLLETPGEFVSREELARVLWPDLHVLFDRSLNTAVNALRRALGDAGRNPRFIETRQGLGYRFIAQVEQVQPAQAPVRSERRGTEAHRDYLKGRYFSNKLTAEDLHKSIAHFESALARDPGYALAYTGLADTYIQFAFQGMLPAQESFAHAKKFAEAALRIDDNLAEAHTSIAGVKRHCDWDWTGAELAYRRALELNGNDPRAHRLYADYLATMGRSEEALKEIGAAHELDPLSLVINMEMAWILYIARDFQGAAEQSWKTLAMEPRFAPAQNTLGLAYQQMGMIEEAIVELDNARACSGDHPAAQAALAHALAIAGRRAEAEMLLDALTEMSRTRNVSRYWLAIVNTALGAHDAAFDSLQESYENREAWLLWLKVEPRYEPLREDARFDHLLRRIGMLSHGDSMSTPNRHA